jgi:hypothetical protein
MPQGQFHNLSVTVTPDIIETSIERDSGHCVIADSIRHSIPGVNRVTVDLQTIRFTDPVSSKRYIYLTPPMAQVVLLAFDQGVRPQPQRIRLGKPIQIVKAGPREPGSRAKGGVTVTAETMHKGQEPSDHKVVVHGGVPPKTGALASGPVGPRKGRRRVFGLRTLTP